MYFARYDRLANVEENYEEIINGNFNTQLVLISLKVSSQSRKFEFNVFSIIHLNGHNF